MGSTSPADGAAAPITASRLLIDAFDRVRQTVHHAVEGLDPDQLTYRVDDRANTIAWLVWHLTRIQDDHVAELAGYPQAWHSGGWFDRFALPFDPADHGFGHGVREVAAVQVDAELLTGYHDEVHARTVRYLETLRDEAYDEVVDRSWDPPVTRGVRLVSVVNDDMQHAGQAAFLRGVVDRL
jgi:uncharacterized damage-inducible protein DinB